MQPLSYPSSPSLSRYLFSLFLFYISILPLSFITSPSLSPFILHFAWFSPLRTSPYAFCIFFPLPGSPINTQWKTAVAWLDYFPLYGISHNLTSKQNTSALQTNLKSRVNLTTQEHVEEHCPGEKCLLVLVIEDLFSPWLALCAARIF